MNLRKSPDKSSTSMIEVERKNTEKFEVTISEHGSSTTHTVTLDDDYYQSLTEGKITKEDFLKKWFDLLLERESKESILSSFNVKVINSYFSNFEQYIKGKIC